MPDKVAVAAQRACQAARRAGVLAPPSACQTCDTTHEHHRARQAVHLVGHHWRGYQHPLDVWWICGRCNTRLRGRHDGSLTLEQARRAVGEDLWNPACRAARRREEHERRFSEGLARAVEAAQKLLNDFSAEHELVDPKTAQPGTFEITLGVAYRKKARPAE